MFRLGALTSDTEGIPGVILEAGLMGLPVVATRVGGVPECVLANETGILIDTDDEEGLAEAVLMLLKNPLKRKEMGKRAERWISENFTIDKPPTYGKLSIPRLQKKLNSQ